MPLSGSVLTAVTTQQPHPPSAHILLVPLSPGCECNHSLRDRRGLALLTTTGDPLSVKEMSLTGRGGEDMVTSRYTQRATILQPGFRMAHAHKAYMSGIRYRGTVHAHVHARVRMRTTRPPERGSPGRPKMEMAVLVSWRPETNNKTWLQAIVIRSGVPKERSAFIQAAIARRTSGSSVNSSANTAVT